MINPEEPVVGSTVASGPEDLEAEASYARYRNEDRSLGEIAGELMANASTLVRQEVALAKAEAKDSASKAGKGVGLLAGAGVAALLMLIAVTLGLWIWLAELIGTAADPAYIAGAFATAAIWAVIALILGLAGKSALAKIRGLETTTDTVSKIPNAATGNEEKNR